MDAEQSVDTNPTAPSQYARLDQIEVNELISIKSVRIRSTQVDLLIDEFFINHYMSSIKTNR